MTGLLARRSFVPMLLIVLALPGVAISQEFYEHPQHRHEAYREVRHFGLHGHEEGRLFVIYYVRPSSAAARAGLYPGDRIYSIDGDRIRSIEQFCDELREAREDAEEALDIEFYRQGTLYRVIAPF